MRMQACTIKIMQKYVALARQVYAVCMDFRSKQGLHSVKEALRRQAFKAAYKRTCSILCVTIYWKGMRHKQTLRGICLGAA